MRRARVPIAATFEGFGDRPTFAAVIPLARLLTDDFIGGTYIRDRPGLPAVRLDARPAADGRAAAADRSRPRTRDGIPGNQFIFEPSPDAMLEQLLPRYVRRASTRPCSS